MGRLVVRGLLTRKLRSVLTAVAIVLGVAMISGTFVLTDQISGAFDDIFQAANKGTDVVVKPNGAFGSDANAMVPLYVPESLVPRIKQVPGVRAVNGELTENGYLVVNGQIVKPSGGAPAILASESPDFRVSKLVRALPAHRHGTARARARQAPRGSQARQGRAAGADRHGVRAAPRARVGIIKFPASDGRRDDHERAAYRDPEAGSGSRASSARSASRPTPGVSQQELANRVRAAVGAPRIEVKTGVKDATDQAGDVNKAIGSFLTPALLAFGVIALFVGAFIIFNTFSITVAQRLREFAMLRTLGATRRQVLQAVTAEALVIGLLSSLIGLACGYLVALGIGALFSAVGFGLPTNSPSLAVRTVVLALIVGVGVTLLASIGPARRATKIPPIAALREGAVLPRGRFARFTPALAVLLALGGLLLILQGFSGSGASRSGCWAWASARCWCSSQSRCWRASWCAP